MEMQIDADLLKHERSKRAWSQEHLAQVAGLHGLRTVQRIESSGTASNESMASATVLEMKVADFLQEAARPADQFEFVRSFGLTLPGVKDASSRAGVALKLKGRLLACEAIDRSAEPYSLMLSIPLQRRKALLAKQADVFYLTDHYAPYPAVLVRLSRIKRAVLKELLKESWEFINE